MFFKYLNSSEKLVDLRPLRLRKYWHIKQFCADILDKAPRLLIQNAFAYFEDKWSDFFTEQWTDTSNR